MASHVIVIDSSFRRAKINVTPGKYLTDVLEEACAKLGLSPSNYGLKNNNKTLDLSRTVRQTDLSSGAKLELIVSSRTPSVVSVALQLPQSEYSQIPGGRLMDKVPSDTTLWLILRKFESASTGKNFNFTARGTAQVENGTSGAGRVFFEQPVLNILGRELNTFADLQKTLAQLGFNGGSTLLRLEFKKTETPLEEAMKEISQYFKEDEANTRNVEASSSEIPKTIDTITDTIAKVPSDEPTAEDIDMTTPSEVALANDSVSQDSVQATPLSLAQRKATSQEDESITNLDSTSRPVQVFSAPSSSTPKAALTAHNDSDYEPTIAHAKLHQSRLQASSINKRLPSEAEIAALEQEKMAKLAATKEVIVKIRFPDQSSVVSTFKKEDTAEDLYKMVISCMLKENEPFKLVWTKGGPSGLVPRNEKQLIRDLGFGGSQLVNFLWDDGAGEEARQCPVLKKEYVARAQEVVVPVLAGVETEDKTTTVDPNKAKENESLGKSKGKGLNAFMKGLRKK